MTVNLQLTLEPTHLETQVHGAAGYDTVYLYFTTSSVVFPFVRSVPPFHSGIVAPSWLGYISDHLRQLYSVCPSSVRVSKILHPTFILLSLLFSFIYPTVSSSVIHF